MTPHRLPRATNRNPDPQVEGVAFHSYGPDEEAPADAFRAGDFILTHGSALTSQLIRLGQRLRYWGKERKYAWWNHAALIVSDQGDLIEAVGTGVHRSHLSHYRPTEYTIVRLGPGLASDADRSQAVSYAVWALGQQYGYLSIVSIMLSLLLGGRISFFYDGQSICSGLVARSLERTRAIFDRSPSHIMPADLAKYFAVDVPAKGTSRGKPPRPAAVGPRPGAATAGDPASAGTR